MNIGHYMPGIWDPGGIAGYIRRVSEAQREAGHAVCFLDPTGRYAAEPDPGRRPILVDPGELAGRARELGLDVLHLHANVDPWPRGGPQAVRTVHEHRPYCPSGARYLRRSAVACDRVYGLSACLSGHLVERCGSVRPRELARNFAATARERRTLRGAPVIAISDYVKRQMVRNGFDPGRIRVLRNPAPSPRVFGPPPIEGVPRFLFLGRLVVQKGLQWLLRSLPGVGRPLAVDVGGEGPQLAEMEALADRLGLADSVAFHGWVDEARIDALAADARAIVFPAVWHEPAGLATFDGSARGRAVIAGRTGGIPEYAIEGRNALLVEADDDDGLAAALRLLIDDRDLARRLGEEGHALASGPFSLAGHVEELGRIYAGLGPPPGRAP
jgi:glycosyltransferase involved in cell wall biosynthesis